MLSQRMTKELLIATQDSAQGETNLPSIIDLRKTVTLFDGTLTAFEHGGSVPGGDSKSVILNAVTAPESVASLMEAKALWQPLKNAIAPFMSDDTQASIPVPSIALEHAMRSARERNTRLLTLMNELTSQLDNTARAKANRLRLAQTVGSASRGKLRRAVIFANCLGKCCIPTCIHRRSTISSCCSVIA